MWFGYIKINGKVSQIFIDKNDAEIVRIINQIQNNLKNYGPTIEWDNQFTEKSMDDIIKFIYNK